MGHEEGPVWVPVEEVVWFHDTAIENHGGRHGIRSQGLLEQATNETSAALVLRKHGQHGPPGGLATRPASCSFTRSWTANKRTGWGTANLFAMANGLELVCSPEDSYQAVLGLAASPKGEHEEELLAEFMYDHLWPY